MLKPALFVCLLSTSLAAQWPKHPAPGVPRTADGKPDLSAPAPRLADGKPDLSGVWMVENSGGLFYMAGDLKPGEMQPWAAALLKKREENYRNDTDGINCLPPGPKAGIGVGNLPLRIMQTPALIAVLYEYQTIYRQIFTDGRQLPTGANPTWMGYSTGTWEGDTLVVTTVGYNDRTSIDLAGHPHTEALRTTERYRRVDYGHIELKLTFDDPIAYKRPWTQPVTFDLMPEGDLIEYVCENEKDKPHLVGKLGAEVSVPTEVLSQYAGSYRPGIVVSLVDGQLTINQGTTGEIPLAPHSETNFTMAGTGVEFLKDANGKVTAMVQHWSEGDRNFPRVK